MRICDRSKGLRLVTRTMGGGQINGGHALYAEMEGLLAVDGDCRFWVSWNGNVGIPLLRTGTLAAAMEGEVAARLKYNLWDQLKGNWPGQRGNSDWPDRVLSNGRSAITCSDNCDAAAVPAAVQSIRDAYLDVLKLVWSTGQSPTGPMRIRVDDWRQTGFGSPPKGLIEWPLAIDLEPLAIGPTDPRWGTTGVGVAVTTLEEASLLRRLRDDFNKSDPILSGIPVRRKGTPPDQAEFGLYVRDVVPLEDSSGQIPLNW